MNIYIVLYRVECKQNFAVRVEFWAEYPQTYKYDNLQAEFIQAFLTLLWRHKVLNFLFELKPSNLLLEKRFARKYSFSYDTFFVPSRIQAEFRREHNFEQNTFVRV